MDVCLYFCEKVIEKCFPKNQFLDLVASTYDAVKKKKLLCKVERKEMDKLIKKDKKKIDKMMDTLIKKDVPRDKKIEKCDEKMKMKKKVRHE